MKCKQLGKSGTPQGMHLNLEQCTEDRTHSHPSQIPINSLLRTQYDGYEFTQQLSPPKSIRHSHHDSTEEASHAESIEVASVEIANYSMTGWNAPGKMSPDLIMKPLKEREQP